MKYTNQSELELAILSNHEQNDFQTTVTKAFLLKAATVPQSDLDYHASRYTGYKSPLIHSDTGNPFECYAQKLFV